MAQVEPGRITTCVIRGRIGTVGDQSVVFPDVAQAHRLGGAARSDATLRDAEPLTLRPAALGQRG